MCIICNLRDPQKDVDAAVAFLSAYEASQRSMEKAAQAMLAVSKLDLSDDELRMLARLPEWPTNMQIEEEDHPTARHLEKLGLIKVSRQRMDPVAHWPDWFAGKLPAASLSESPTPAPKSCGVGR
jgi:hypothetical protein